MTHVVVASVVESLAKLAQPWKDLYDDTTPLSVAVTFVHLAALFVGGGIALSADRATLRAGRGAAADRERQLTELGPTHRVVLGGLVVAFVSGLLLFLADVETFATSITFWVKMGLVTLLLVNGAVMTTTERALRAASDDARWGRLRVLAVTSATLWLATLLAGVALTSA